jgi:protein involved in polysaccharide export with SLBB domain
MKPASALPRRTARIAAALFAALLVLTPLAAAQGERRADGDDFRPGDRILLRVEGEQQLTDTFTVHEGPALELPAIGRVSLAGVSHTELEPYLKQQLAKYLKSPVIRARALLRVGIIGELARPGYYNVPSDALVSDLLTVAGGPTNNSKTDNAKIERAGATVVKSDSLRRAFASGLTVSQVGLHSGDNLFVPRAQDSEHVWRIVAIIVTIPAAIAGIVLLSK